MDPFELVEIADRLALQRHRHPPPLGQRRRVEEAQLGRAVAHDDVGAVAGQAPAFALIGPFAELPQRGAVPAIAGAALPGDRDDLIAPIDDALAELGGGERHRLEDPAVGDVDPADRRLADIGRCFRRAGRPGRRALA